MILKHKDIRKGNYFVLCLFTFNLPISQTARVWNFKVKTQLL